MANDLMKCGHPLRFQAVNALVQSGGQELQAIDVTCEICEQKPFPVRQYAAELLGNVPIEPNQQEQQFAEMIVADPSDITPRLVFANWLEEQGDERG